MIFRVRIFHLISVSQTFSREIPQREITAWNTNFLTFVYPYTNMQNTFLLCLVGSVCCTALRHMACCATHFPWSSEMVKYQNIKSVARWMKWWKICSASKVKRFFDQLRELSTWFTVKSIDLNWTQLISLIDRFFFRLFVLVGSFVVSSKLPKVKKTLGLREKWS